MKEAFSRFSLSAVVGLFLASAHPLIAADAVVYWDSNSGFNTTSVSINAGDSVNIVNNDDPDWGFPVNVVGKSPEYFIISIPPGYYYPHQYMNSGLFSFSENWFGDTVYVTVSTPAPLAVAITEPTNNSVFTAPAAFTLTAEPTGGDGYYDVEFFIGTDSIDHLYYEPFTTEVANLPPGNYTVSAVVTDYYYNQATNSISITVTGGATIRLNSPRMDGSRFLFDAVGLTVGKTNVVEFCTDLATGGWNPIVTNVATAASQTITNSLSATQCYYRVIEQN